jgi:hypothetical protein
MYRAQGFRRFLNGALGEKRCSRVPASYFYANLAFARAFMNTALYSKPKIKLEEKPNELQSRIMAAFFTRFHIGDPPDNTIPFAISDFLSNVGKKNAAQKFSRNRPSDLAAGGFSRPWCPSPAFVDPWDFGFLL